MQPLSANPNHYKKVFAFFLFSIRKEKCQVNKQKNEKQNLMRMI